MTALFDLPDKYADISDDGLYRYTLGRRWGEGVPATFIMLNPSTADADVDDPTIRRCVGFAKAWGLSGIHVVNLYAFRATKPTALWKTPDPVGPRNDRTLGDTMRAARFDGGPVVAAWGANARTDRVLAVQRIADDVDLSLSALGVTKGGAPRHPLYMPSASTADPWRTTS